MTKASIQINQLTPLIGLEYIVCQPTYTLIMTDFDGHEELIMSE
jgi:hypothetical protein